MPIGGALHLKGNLKVTSSGVEKTKKKKKKTKKEAASDGEQPEGQETDKPVGISVVSNKSYEEEFALEMNKVQKKAGSAAHKVLHGYDKKVKGKTAEERLDMRSSMKSDKFCK